MLLQPNFFFGDRASWAIGDGSRSGAVLIGKLVGSVMALHNLYYFLQVIKTGLSYRGRRAIAVSPTAAAGGLGTTLPRAGLPPAGTR
jgi:hypothetical protein